MQRGGGDDLHGEDERLVDRALAGLVNATQRAPDRHQGSREGGEAADEASERRCDRVAQWGYPHTPFRRMEDGESAIRDQEGAEAEAIRSRVYMQKEPCSPRDSERAAQKHRRHSTPSNVCAQ